MSAQASIPHLNPQLIEVKVAGMEQLFNSMDPSPFHERDLDHDAELFIVSWAQEYPVHEPLKLLVHLGRSPEGVDDPQQMIQESVRHYFEYQADMIRREFRQLMKEGRTALIIGVTFLALCELIVQSMPESQDTWSGVLREGLAIIGWVAMWRPLDIYLYRWWPIRRRERVYRNLSEIEVEVKCLS